MKLVVESIVFNMDSQILNDINGVYIYIYIIYIYINCGMLYISYIVELIRIRTLPEQLP